MKHVLIAALCSAALGWPAAVSADGGGSGDAAYPTYSRENGDPDFTAGLQAVSRKDWQEVVARMGAYTQRRPDDADGWNELGHAYRQTGRMEPALDAYDKALKINPKHRGAREYLGEAFLQMNDLTRAEQELKQLDRLCLFGCREYTVLKQSIEQYKRGRQAGAGS